LVLEALLAEDGQALLYLPFANYAQATLEPAREMLEHPHTVPGLGDGGAHLGMIADASFTTFDQQAEEIARMLRGLIKARSPHA
jgi:N-acyl-D-aspartate/D-glutamate deacylase